MTTIPHDEWERYADEHEAIHGHRPMRDLLSGKLCTHPMHDDVRRIIDGPGVDIVLDFDPHEGIADDDPRVLAFQRGYEMAVAVNKARIAELDEEDRRLLNTHCTVGIHDVRVRTIPSPVGGRMVDRRQLYCRREGCGWTRWET